MSPENARKLMGIYMEVYTKVLYFSIRFLLLYAVSYWVCGVNETVRLLVVGYCVQVVSAAV